MKGGGGERQHHFFFLVVGKLQEEQLHRTFCRSEMIVGLEACVA